MKKIICVALAAIMICGLFVGCGETTPTQTPTNIPTQTPTGTPEPTTTPEPSNEYEFKTDSLVELDYWIPWGSGDAYDSIEMAVEDFNELYDGKIKVTMEFNAGGVSAILAAFKAKLLPEVFALYFSYQANYFAQGISIDLRPYAELTEFDYSDFMDGFWMHLTYGENVIGLPLAPSGIVLVYNKKMYEDKLGHTKAPTTLDELMDFSKKLTVVEGKETKVYGFTFDRSDGTFIGTLGRAYGAVWYGEDGTGCPGAYDGTVKKAFQYIRTFVDSGAFYKPATSGTGNANIAALNSGAVAQICAFTSQIKNIWLSKGENEYLVELMPGVTAGQEGFQEFAGRANAISSLASEKEKEAGWLFIEYCVSPEQEIVWGLNCSYTVRRTSSGELPELVKYWEENPQYQVAYRLLQNVDPYQYPINLNQFSADRNSIVDMIIYEKTGATKAITYLQDSAEDNLTVERPKSILPTAENK